MELTRAVFHLGIVVAFAGPIDDVQRKAMSAEAAAIWRPYGVQVTWFDAEADCSSDEGAWLAPVDRLLHLVADTAQPAGSSALGAVRFSNGAPDDTIRLLYTTVYRMVDDAAVGAWPVRTLPAPVRSRLMGRALGRVVAHEIGHVLLDYPAHERSGLMRPSFVPSDLLIRDHDALRLSKPFVDRLEHLLRRQPIP